MKNLWFTFTMGTFLYSCTHGNISRIPKIVNGEKVFTYQGRANFGHQLRAADDMMLEHCKEFNQGTPVAMNHEKENLGYIVNVNSSGGSAIGNQNQIIQFKCIK